ARHRSLLSETEVGRRVEGRPSATCDHPSDGREAHWPRFTSLPALAAALVAAAPVAAALVAAAIVTAALVAATAVAAAAAGRDPLFQLHDAETGALLDG